MNPVMFAMANAPMFMDVNFGSSGGIGQAIILLVVVIIVLGFVWWVNNNYVPEPLRKYGVLVIVLMCAIFLINFVLSIGGHGFIHW